MTIPPEVAEAAKRLKANAYTDAATISRHGNAFAWNYSMERAKDNAELADFALSLIATAEREAEEGQKPLTEEKLIAFGFERDGEETLRIRWEQFSYKNELVISLKVGFAAVTQILRNSEEDFEDDPDCCVQLPCPTTVTAFHRLAAALKIELKETPHAK